MDDMRDRIAAALEAADYRMDMKRGDLADAVMTVVGPEVDQLRAAADPAKVEVIRRLVRSTTRIVQLERDDARQRAEQAEAKRDALKADLTRARALLDTALRLRMDGAAYDPEWMVWDRATERLLRGDETPLDHPTDTPPRRRTEQEGGIPNDAITRADWASAYGPDTAGETP